MQDKEYEMNYEIVDEDGFYQDRTKNVNFYRDLIQYGKNDTEILYDLYNVLNDLSK